MDATKPTAEVTLNDVLVISRACLRVMKKSGKHAGNPLKTWIAHFGNPPDTARWLDRAFGICSEADDFFTAGFFGPLWQSCTLVANGLAGVDHHPEYPIHSISAVIDRLEKIESWERHG